jgi:peptidoglycan/LPS O-acetylase OafA/YrhL
MGSYRFLLAATVVISHGLITWWSYNPGVIAVISFFMISGYAMAGKLSAHYPTARHIGSFYLDRLVRLFPLYLFFMCITAALFYVGWIASPDFLSDMTTGRAVLNAFILPLGIHRDLGIDMSRSSFIPQAWSLALEITFYASVPFLMLASKGTLRFVAVLSCAVSVAASMQVIPGSAFLYYLLPGTLFIFVIGVLIKTGRDPELLSGLITFSVAAVLYAHMGTAPSIAREVAIGIVLSTIAVALLDRFQRGNHPLDLYLGDLSYGVFLSHFIFIWLIRTQTETGHSKPLTDMEILTVMGCSVVTAAISLNLVERPIDRWRRSLRRTQHGATLSTEPVDATREENS